MLTATPSRPTPQRLRGGAIVPLLLALAALIASLTPLARRAEESRHHDTAAYPGEPASLAFDAVAPTIPGLLDVVIVLDQSSSYDDDLRALRRQLPVLVADLESRSDLRFGFFGFDDRPAEFTVHLPLSDDTSGLSPMLTALRANGGGEEKWLHALEQVARTQSFRPEASKVIVLATDEPSGIVGGVGVDEVAELLNDEQLQLVALIPRDEDLPQANDLAAKVGGVIQDVASDSSDIEQAITDGLRDLPVDIVPVLVPSAGCPIEPGTETFDPPQILGAEGGSEAAFTIDFAIADDADHGLYDCVIDLGEHSEPFVLRVRR